MVEERTYHVSKGTYKGIDYIVVQEGDYHYTLIAKGREVCVSTSISRVKAKFKALVDTGWK